jgi:hypothetical protein
VQELNGLGRPKKVGLPDNICLAVQTVSCAHPRRFEPTDRYFRKSPDLRIFRPLNKPSCEQNPGLPCPSDLESAQKIFQMTPSMPLQTDDRPCSADDPDVRHRVSSTFAVMSILIAAGFIYASTVPLVFAVPDYRARLTGICASFPTESGRTFDWTVNFLALIPLGFCWSGTLASRVSPSSSARRTFGRVAWGCLALAALAETLQVWLPVRVPALRDLIALEGGACLGCGLWWLVGAPTTNFCCRIWQRSTAGSTARLPSLPWLVLFGLLLSGCLAINTWASPSQCFQMYRHRTFSSHSAGPERVWNAANALLASTGTALALLGICGLGVRVLERTWIRSADGLRIFVPTAEPASGLSVASHRVGNLEIDETTLDRAA